jgi:hypothetical protein
MNEEQVQESRSVYTTTSDEAIEDITVGQMTASQLKKLIRSVVEETLQEMLGDPDAGLELSPEFEQRLRQAVTYVSSGGHLLSMNELTDELEAADGV